MRVFIYFIIIIYRITQLFQPSINNNNNNNRSTWWCSQLRDCAIRRKVAGSIPNCVIRIFHWHKPSARAVALRSNEPLTEMSTRNISWWVKVGGALGWQPYHFHGLSVLKSGSLYLLEPSGHVHVCNGGSLSIIIIIMMIIIIIIIIIKFRNCTMKTFDRSTTKDSYTWNITHNTESTAVWSLKSERWGSPLIQDKYREEKPLRRDINNNNNNNNNVHYKAGIQL